MDWQEKFAALSVIADTSLRMRKPGDWYVAAQGRAIAGDGLLTGSYGNGASPQAAVEDDWRKMVETLPVDRYIAVERYGTRKNFRWNGFMWSEVLS